MLETHEYLKMLISLIAIVNPIGALPVFVSLTYQYDEVSRKRIARDQQENQHHGKPCQTAIKKYEATVYPAEKSRHKGTFNQ